MCISVNLYSLCYGRILYSQWKQSYFYIFRMSVSKAIWITLKSPILFALILVLWIGLGIGLITGSNREKNIYL